MITRYSRPDAVALWSQETKYKIWFEIEAHAATKMAELGVIPREAADAIWAKGGDATFDADRIDEIERTTKHDVIAFLTHVAEIVGEGVLGVWVAESESREQPTDVSTAAMASTAPSVRPVLRTSMFISSWRRRRARLTTASRAGSPPAQLSRQDPQLLCGGSSGG